jgi:hypothetical protein
MRIPFFLALFSLQKRLLLLLFTFSYTYFSFAQNQEFQIPDQYLAQRDAYVLTTDDFIIVSDTAKIDGQVIFQRKLTHGYRIIKVKGELPRSYVGKANTKWKLSPSLLKLQAGDVPYLSGVPEFILTTCDWSGLKRQLAAENIPIIKEYPDARTILIRIVAPSEFQKILSSPYVTFIDMARSLASEETLNSFQDLSVNSITYVHAHHPYLTGVDMTVSIRERTIEKSDIDLKGRILDSPLEDDLISFHANQMATIIAGGGNSSEDSKGVAWKSRVVSASFNSSLPDPDDFFSDFGISVQNHSYGFEIENYYGAEARAFDLQSNGMENLLHVFSAGNKGEEISTAGTYAGITGFANLSGNMKMSKNSISAGGHYNEFSIDARNSRGPAYDGRIKPEVTAFGPEGTSDAAAYVSGLALILQDAYGRQHGDIPAAALTRLILAISADDMLRPGPDYESGFGSVNARRAVEWILSGQFYSGNISAGETHSYEIELPEGIAQLRVGIGWNDPAAEAGSSVALVNDLDLQIDKDGQVTLPWTLNAFPHPDSLAKAAVRGEDHVNNIELCTILDPVAGKYKVNVKGFDVTASQKYFVAFWLDTAEVFSWTYPVKMEKKESDKDIFLRWSTTFTGQAELTVSYDGAAYEPISTISLQDKFFQWHTPLEARKVNFKMRIAGQEFVSDTLLISPAMDFSVGYNCTDQGMINWNKMPGADSYLVFNLQEKYVEPVIATADTVYTFQASALSSYFAVAAVYDGTVAKRSLTYDYRSRGVSCYYKFFDAQINNLNKAELSVYLSTLFNVDQVAFEKRIGGEFIEIGRVDVQSAYDYKFMDDEVEGGITTYRAVIKLLSGETVITNEAQLVYADENTFAVFPNPYMQDGNSLNIITDASDVEMELLNVSGQVIANVKVASSFFQMNTPYLPPGLYVYRFLRQGRVMNTGKLLIK